MKKFKQIETELQTRLLSDYFQIEGKTATVKLVYETFAELVNPNFGDDRTEKLNEKLFSDIKEAIDMLPRGYKLNVDVVIRDFGDYTLEECEAVIRQNIELSVYLVFKSMHRLRWSGLSLMLAGAAVLIVSYFLHRSDYDVLFDVINISGTLFVWEGANTAFLERNNELRSTTRVNRVLQNVCVRRAGEQPGL